MKKAEWKRRYADRIANMSNSTKDYAEQCAIAAFDTTLRDSYPETPEEAADVEMSYWDSNDE